MAYRYEIIILDPKKHSYIEAADSSDSFVDALSRMFMRNLQLCDRILSIYCRRPRDVHEESAAMRQNPIDILPQAKVRGFPVHGHIRWYHKYIKGKL